MVTRVVLLTGLLLAAGCRPPGPAGPTPVLPRHLAAAYAADRPLAGRAYGGRALTLPLTGFRRAADGTLVWSLGAGPGSRPVIVAAPAAGEFPVGGPEPPAGTWLVGDLYTVVEDGVQRELPGYTFTIRLRNCRPAAAPAP